MFSFSPTIKLHQKKCIICKRPVFSNMSKYCLECHKFEQRLHGNSTRRFSRQAIKGIWDFVRKKGYVCYYTGMKLEMNDPKSPWYCVFDHWLPGDPRKIVLTSALLNGMKSDLTEKEFWYFVIQLDNCRKKHIQIRKRRVKYWVRLYPAGHKRPAGLLLVCTPALAEVKRNCIICGKPIHEMYKSYPKYCNTCAHLARRMDDEDFSLAVVDGIWDHVRQRGYVCYYTGLKLELNNEQSPWYCVFDHWIPGDDSKVVLTLMTLITWRSLWFTPKEPRG